MDADKTNTSLGKWNLNLISDKLKHILETIEPYNDENSRISIWNLSGKFINIESVIQYIKFILKFFNIFLFIFFHVYHIFVQEFVENSSKLRLLNNY